MSETPIADSVLGAITEVFQAREEKGLPTAFVSVIALLQEDGTHALSILSPTSQPTHVSMGMIAYAEEWFRDDVRFQINALVEGEDG